MTGLPVDGHVHFHHLARVAPTLDSAAANFRRLPSHGSAPGGALLLAQATEEAVFEKISESGTAGRWKFEPVEGEPESLIACAEGYELLVVCGRQVRCESGLEVLALGTLERYPDGRRITDTIDRVMADGAIAVVPWGFLKWRGARGDVVQELFAKYSDAALFFGDNGGRVGSLGMPRLLRQAEAEGFKVIPGSDPFPAEGEHMRVGAFGFLVHDGLDVPGSWQAIRRWLHAATASPPAYGRGVAPLRFAYNQVWIQARNRRLRRYGRR